MTKSKVGSQKSEGSDAVPASVSTLEYAVALDIGDQCPKCGRAITEVEPAKESDSWLYHHRVESVIPGVPQGTFCVVEKEFNEVPI